MNQLTEREIQVLSLIADGHGNQAIANLLYLSVDTVKTHLVRLRLKLDATDRAHAVARGYETGILRVTDPLSPASVRVKPEPTQRWVNASVEKIRSEALREYRQYRREFSQIEGATQAGGRALWRLADLHPQQFRALVADEMGHDEPGQVAA